MWLKQDLPVDRILHSAGCIYVFVVETETGKFLSHTETLLKVVHNEIEYLRVL